jgi:hypothetical protein
MFMMPPKNQTIPTEGIEQVLYPQSIYERTWITNESPFKLLLKNVSKLNSEGIWIHHSDVF